MSEVRTRAQQLGCGEVADPFEVLGVEPDADSEVVDEVYRRLVQIYHPDRFGGAAEGVRQEAERRMMAVNEARDEIRRQRSHRRPAKTASVILECPHCAHRERVAVSDAASASCSRCAMPFSSAANTRDVRESPKPRNESATSAPEPPPRSKGLIGRFIDGVKGM